MRLEGVHHVTAISGDVLQNVNFYTGVLGLRLAAKSVNQDDPSVYHVFYSDEHGRVRTSRSSNTAGLLAAAPAPAWCTACCGG